jgi:hypothetical protein
MTILEAGTVSDTDISSCTFKVKRLASQRKPKGLNRIDKNGSCYPCLREIELSLNKLLYLGTVNFKHKYI